MKKNILTTLTGKLLRTVDGQYLSCRYDLFDAIRKDSPPSNPNNYNIGDIWVQEPNVKAWTLGEIIEEKPIAFTEFTGTVECGKVSYDVNTASWGIPEAGVQTSQNYFIGTSMPIRNELSEIENITASLYPCQADAVLQEHFFGVLLFPFAETLASAATLFSGENALFSFTDKEMRNVCFVLTEQSADTLFPICGVIDNEAILQAGAETKIMLLYLMMGLPYSNASADIFFDFFAEEPLFEEILSWFNDAAFAAALVPHYTSNCFCWAVYTENEWHLLDMAVGEDPITEKFYAAADMLREAYRTVDFGDAAVLIKDSIANETFPSDELKVALTECGFNFVICDGGELIKKRKQWVD